MFVCLAGEREESGGGGRGGELDSPLWECRAAKRMAHGPPPGPGGLEQNPAMPEVVAISDP